MYNLDENCPLPITWKGPKRAANSGHVREIEIHADHQEIVESVRFTNLFNIAFVLIEHRRKEINPTSPSNAPTPQILLEATSNLTNTTAIQYLKSVR